LITMTPTSTLWWQVLQASVSCSKALDALLVSAVFMACYRTDIGSLVTDVIISAIGFLRHCGQ